MRLFLRVCLTTACRKSEALGLRWHQVDLERSVARLHDTKNGDSRALPLVSDVKATLANAKKVRALGGGSREYCRSRPLVFSLVPPLAEQWPCSHRRTGSPQPARRRRRCASRVQVHFLNPSVTAVRLRGSPPDLAGKFLDSKN
jgi:integrase